MPIQAQSADGIVHEFPDGTDQSIVDKAMKSYSQKKAEPDKLSLGDVAIGAAVNAPRSAVEFAKNVAQPFLHPIQTAENIGKLGLGVGEKLGIPGTQGYGQFADAAGQAFMQRYGGWENLKKTIANDPVGFVGDISLAFTGAGGALRAVPALSEAAETASTIGRVVNPVNVAGKAVGKAGEIVPQVIGNLGTGTGAAPIKTAVSAGMQGNKTFLANMRDPEANAAALVPQARKALEAVRLERSGDYQRAMAQFGQRANKPLKFDDVDKAVASVEDTGKFLGRDISQLAGENELTAAQQTIQGIKRNVAAWKTLPPEYQTAAGFDKFKQFIGEKYIDWKGGKDAANKVAQQVYHAIRDTIVKQDPHYAEIMKDYSEASDLLNELEKTLSLGKKASEDTALRKLLSTTRSNVNTNFGKRAQLADILNQRQPNLVPGLAGQALAGWTPQGLNKLIAGGLAGLSLKDLKALGALPFTSPRLVGETAYKVGQGAGKINQLTPDVVKQLMARINPDVLKQALLLQQQVGRASQ